MAVEKLADSFTSEAENTIFGRRRKSNEPFGVIRRLAIAQTTRPEIARVCQDGGVVTTLLLFALESGQTDAALVTLAQLEKPLYPVARVATTAEEILAAAGSKYTCSRNTLTLASEAIKQGKTSVAFVGMPCQIRALRRQQFSNPRKLDHVPLSVGLMCSGCFSYDLVTEFIEKKMGIDPRSVLKINIKGKMQITTESGVTLIPLSEINSYKQKGCKVCRDFSSELSDISVGGLGLDGWSFVVIRSDRGEELFCKAETAGVLRTMPVGADASPLKLLTKLSQKKNKHARKE